VKGGLLCYRTKGQGIQQKLHNFHHGEDSIWLQY
jgi:hypothetical protein